MGRMEFSIDSSSALCSVDNCGLRIRAFPTSTECVRSNACVIAAVLDCLAPVRGRSCPAVPTALAQCRGSPDFAEAIAIAFQLVALGTPAARRSSFCKTARELGLLCRHRDRD